MADYNLFLHLSEDRGALAMATEKLSLFHTNRLPLWEAGMRKGSLPVAEHGPFLHFKCPSLVPCCLWHKEVGMSSTIIFPFSIWESGLFVLTESPLHPRGHFVTTLAYTGWHKWHHTKQKRL